MIVETANILSENNVCIKHRFTYAVEMAKIVSAISVTLIRNVQKYELFHKAKRVNSRKLIFKT